MGWLLLEVSEKSGAFFNGRIFLSKTMDKELTNGRKQPFISERIKIVKALDARNLISSKLCKAFTFYSFKLTFESPLVFPGIVLHRKQKFGKGAYS